MIDTVLNTKESCTGCYACFSICPVNCISIDMDSEGFGYPHTDTDKCIKCRKCVAVCPIIKKRIVKNNPSAFACINKNENIRLTSSSGGVFSAISENVIDRGGVVFGAAFNSSLELHHSYCESLESLHIYRGSKYLQSQIGDSYKNAKTFLDAGRLVFFTGTPCQIGGLNSFLGKQYDNLITADIICHGVPSPKVFNVYVNIHEKISGSAAQHVLFRSKSTGWRDYSVNFNFANGTSYTETHHKDPYMRAFLNDLCLRPSCYECKFKDLQRLSDITLADFWGANEIIPDMYDNKGISLVLANSEKGKTIINNISENLIIREVQIENAIRFNTSAIKSASKNPNRTLFIEQLNDDNFEYMVNKYCKNTLSKLIKRIMRVALRKLSRYKALVIR